MANKDYAPAKVASAVTVLSGETMGGKHDGTPVIVVGFRTGPHVIDSMAIDRQAARKLTDGLLATFAELYAAHHDEYTALRQLFNKLQEQDDGGATGAEGRLFDGD